MIMYHYDFNGKHVLYCTSDLQCGNWDYVPLSIPFDFWILSNATFIQNFFVSHNLTKSHAIHMFYSFSLTKLVKNYNDTFFSSTLTFSRTNADVWNEHGEVWFFFFTYLFFYRIVTVSRIRHDTCIRSNSVDKTFSLSFFILLQRSDSR